MKIVLLFLGVAGLVGGAYFLYQYLYQASSADKSNLIWGGAFFLVALVSFAIFFFKRFREEGEHQSDMSITANRR